MSYYNDFIEARNVVLGVYPNAVCKYLWGSFTVFQNSRTTDILDTVGSSFINEPDAWMTAAEEIKNDFLLKLEN